MPGPSYDRRLSTLLCDNAAWLVLPSWWLLAGPIFSTEAADGTTRLCLALIVAFVIVDLVTTVRRTTSIRPPMVRA